jgi:hypothetical protein
MNAVTKIRRESAAPESPATIARREHEAKLADIDRQLAATRERISRTRAVLAEAEGPGRELAALEDKLAAVIAARLTGTAPTEDSTDIEAAIAAKSVEAAAQAATLKGAQLALDLLNRQLDDLSRQKAAELERRRDVQLAELAERLEQQAAIAETVIAPYLDWIAETFALALVRDRLKRPHQPPCSGGFAAKFYLPAPINLGETFATVATERNLAPAVERFGAAILAELGVERLPAA